MFGLSWDQIILILLAGLFLLGPERIPTAIKWIMDSLRKVRTFAAGAQSEMRSQLGPELDELRRQIAELQSLKELKELRELRELDPRRMVGKTLLGDEFSGGIKGFLGLTGTPAGQAANGADGVAATAAPSTRIGAPAQPTAPAAGEPAAAAEPVTPAISTPVTPTAPVATENPAREATQQPAASTGGAWADAEFT